MSNSEQEYNHDFQSALQALMHGQSIQGEKFPSGFYVALDESGIAAQFDVKDNNRRFGNFFLTVGLYKQKYRVLVTLKDAITH